MSLLFFIIQIILNCHSNTVFININPHGVPFVCTISEYIQLTHKHTQSGTMQNPHSYCLYIKCNENAITLNIVGAHLCQAPEKE